MPQQLNRLGERCELLDQSAVEFLEHLLIRCQWAAVYDLTRRQIDLYKIVAAAAQPGLFPLELRKSFLLSVLLVSPEVEAVGKRILVVVLEL